MAFAVSCLSLVADAGSGRVSRLRCRRMSHSPRSAQPRTMSGRTTWSGTTAACSVRWSGRMPAFQQLEVLGVRQEHECLGQRDCDQAGWRISRGFHAFSIRW